MHKITTLGQFIIEKQSQFPYAKGELSRLLRDIGIAAKMVNREINKAGLADILGDTGIVNVQQELVKKLDVFANEQFISALKYGGECCLIVSEENEEMIPFYADVSPNAKYVVAIDPLDGSSNIDVNVSVGTIFSIYRRLPDTVNAGMDDILQPGSKQVAAGYIIYGSSTMMVYTTGHGVNGFTLDPSIGEFCLSHPDLKIPAEGNIYSVNEGNYVHFPEGVKRYLQYCKQDDPQTDRPYISRYIGSLVADFHRNLIRGGIFIYPGTFSHPDGKLRLIYECNPIAFIAEQAGGMATNGKDRILDIHPQSFHQRSALFTGSTAMVRKSMNFLQDTSKQEISWYD